MVLISFSLLITPVLAQTSISDQIANLRSQIATLTTQLNALLAEQRNQTGWCVNFDQNFGRGEKSEKVDQLVKTLKPEISASYTEFNDNVLGWVKDFQTKHGIPNTGYVGPLTRAKLNELYGCQHNPQAPVISGLSGPTSLKVGEMGTWKITARDPLNGILNYQITWGDELHSTGALFSEPSTTAEAQVSTFTHAYAAAGTYTVRATVIGSNQRSAFASITVNVGSTTQTPIAVTSPNGGETWLANSTKTISWKQLNKSANAKVDLYLDPVWSCPPGMYCTLIKQLPYTLDKNISGTSYSWIVATDINDNPIPAGQYRMMICEAGSQANCDSSDAPFTIVSSTTPA